jgi:tetratricopeptide (TPR) repeat protein
MKILFLFALVLTGTANVRAANLNGIQNHELIAKAQTLRTDERIRLLEERASADRGNAEIQVALAEALLQKLRETGDAGYLTRASKAIEPVVAANPKNAPALRVRNAIEMNLHHFPQVASYAEPMIARNPSDAPTLSLLGDALMEMGRYAEAGDTYERMAALGGNLFSYNRLAYYQFVTGHPDEALGWMSQAIRAGSASPENVAWCLSEMGDMLFKTGRTKDAEVAFRMALRSFAGYHRAEAGLGRVLAAQGHLDDAIAHLKRAQAVVPLPEYAGLLEALYGQTGDRVGAARQQRLIEATDNLMSANGEKANRNLALLYADAGRNLPRALELARAEFEVRNDVYTYDALSWALYKNGDVEGAAAAGRKAMALGTPEPSFYFHAGMIDAARGDGDSARVHLSKALSLNPAFDIRNARLASSTIEQLARAKSDRVPDSY